MLRKGEQWASWDSEGFSPVFVWLFTTRGQQNLCLVTAPMCQGHATIQCIQIIGKPSEAMRIEEYMMDHTHLYRVSVTLLTPLWTVRNTPTYSALNNPSLHFWIHGKHFNWFFIMMILGWSQQTSLFEQNLNLLNLSIHFYKIIHFIYIINIILYIFWFPSWSFILGWYRFGWNAF